MLIGWILLLIAVAEFILGLYLIFRYERSQATTWYGLFCITVSMYVLGNGLGYANILSGRWAEHIAWVGGISTAILFLPFSFTFPLPRKTVGALLPWVLWPVIIFIPGLLFTNLFVKQQGIVQFGAGYETAAGPFFWFMILMFSAYWVWGITNLMIRMFKSDGTHRKYLRLILIGVFSSLVISSIFDIYMPLTHSVRYGYFGSLFSTIWLGFTSYIIVRK